MEKLKMSIVTVVFNGENYLERTIKSIVNQTYKNVEYIIIDGNSKDGTLAIIDKYKENISYWISEPDKGIYDAMNKSLDLITGDFVWFINAGDEIHDNKTIENIFYDYKNYDAFYGKTQIIRENGSYASITKTPSNLSWKSFVKGMVVSHQSIIFSVKKIQKYNLDYKIVSDQDWIISILKNCNNIKNTNLILSKYLLGGFSNKNFYNGWKEKFSIIYKHYNFLNYAENIYYFFIAMNKRLIKKYILKRT